MRIGIFGGTFNPIHKGHERIAHKAIETGELDRLIVMPANVPPHKTAASLATAADRLEMCRLAFDGDEKITVSDMELRRDGPSYSVDTVTQLKAQYPDDELFMVIGTDMLLSFDRWYRYKDILSMCRLCVFARDGETDCEALRAFALNNLGLDYTKGEIVVCECEPLEISSTQLRRMLEAGEDTSVFISQTVRNYIAEKKVLVKDTDRVDEFKTVIRSMLGDYRYTHSLNVADSAVYLARLFGEDENVAYVAGLLHDVTKDTPKEKQLELCEKAGIILTPSEKANKNLWHAMSGAAYLETVLNIKNRDIINAVRYHTTGRAGMSKLERIIYTADFISAERSYPDVEVMRTLSAKSLDEADLYALKFCITKLVKDGLILHTDSVDFYNELVRGDTNE